MTKPPRRNLPWRSTGPERRRVRVRSGLSFLDSSTGTPTWWRRVVTLLGTPCRKSLLAGGVGSEPPCLYFSNNLSCSKLSGSLSTVSTPPLDPTDRGGRLNPLHGLVSAPRPIGVGLNTNRSKECTFGPELRRPHFQRYIDTVDERGFCQ